MLTNVERIAGGGGRLLVMRPGAVTRVWDVEGPVSVGSVVVSTAVECTDEHLGQVARARLLAPWAPLVLHEGVTNPTVWPELSLICGEAHVVCVPRQTTGPSIDAVWRTVCARPSVGLDGFCRYVAMRLSPRLADGIASAACEGTSRSLRRELRRFGRFGPGRWAAACRLFGAWEAAVSSLHGKKRASEVSGVAPITLTRWSRGLVGLSWKELSALAVWEGVAELVLRSACGEGVAGEDGGAAQSREWIGHSSL